MKHDIFLSYYYNMEEPVFPDKPELGKFMHALKAMEILGITFEKAEPQSIVDGWKFYNCKNIPENLPNWLTVRERKN